jgi:hypothetical protein
LISRTRKKRSYSDRRVKAANGVAPERGEPNCRVVHIGSEAKKGRQAFCRVAARIAPVWAPEHVLWRIYWTLSWALIFWTPR